MSRLLYIAVRGNREHDMTAARDRRLYVSYQAADEWLQRAIGAVYR